MVMSDGLVIVDRDRVILDVNPAFSKLFGFEREELLGLPPPYPFGLPKTSPGSSALSPEACAVTRLPTSSSSVAKTARVFPFSSIRCS